jgi:hypothetical protein
MRFALLKPSCGLSGELDALSPSFVLPAGVLAAILRDAAKGPLKFVMPGLVPGIHVFAAWQQERRGWPGRARP